MTVIATLRTSRTARRSYLGALLGLLAPIAGVSACAIETEEPESTNGWADDALRRHCTSPRCQNVDGGTDGTAPPLAPAPAVDGGSTPTATPPTASPPLTPPASPPSPPPTRTATSCSQSAVQAAINASVDGDVVAVPKGTCTWSNAVSIEGKTITLRGAGSGSGGTKIVYGGTNHPLLSLDAVAKKGLMDVSGFWFVGGDPDYWNGTAIQFYGPSGWKNVRIHHNVFDGNGPWTIKGGSSTHGLIDHNTFRGTAAGIMLYGNGAADWAAPLVLGTADFFFVEDNLFTFDDNYGVTKHPVMDMDMGGRQVFRHNKVVHGMWETHDKARSGLVSANAYEIYENDFSTATNQWKGLDISAGTGVVWGNDFAGDYTNAIGAMDYKSFDPRSVKLCDGTDPADQNVAGQAGWRCQYQIGSMGEGPTAYGYPLHLWGNTRNGSAVGMVCTAGCNHVKAGRDFINGAGAKPGYTPYPYPHPRAK